MKTTDLLDLKRQYEVYGIEPQCVLCGSKENLEYQETITTSFDGKDFNKSVHKFYICDKCKSKTYIN